MTATTRKSTARTAKTSPRNKVSAQAAAPAEAAGAAEVQAAEQAKAAARAAKVSPHRAEVARLAGEGKTVAEIATATGLTVAGVRWHLKAAGLSAARAERVQRVSPKRAQVASLAAEGRTAAEIAAATGLSVAGARHHLKALGITAMAPGRDTAATAARRARVAELLAADPKPTRQAIADELGVSVHAVAHDIAVARRAA